MKPKHILIIIGHPARQRRSFCEVLALAYEQAAALTGHEVQRVSIAQLQFDPILHEGYQGNQTLEPDIAAVQETIRWAEHIVIVYPMWQFSIPALLKGFLERVLTRGFAYAEKPKNPLKAGLLLGKSVRLIQTMGMPAFFYRLFCGGHGAKALMGMLRFCGLGPVRITYLGMIEGSNERRELYLEKVAGLGRLGN